MPTPTKLPPSQLTALEQAFSAAPASDAWRPLAEAYLAAGRHLEAGVVARKAARAHPQSAAPRVFVARVLVAQGKVERARAELGAIRAVHPTDADALALARELGEVGVPPTSAPPPPGGASAAPGAPATGSAGQRGAARPRGAPPPHLDPAYARELQRRFGDREDPPRDRRARARRALVRTVAAAVVLGAVLAALAVVTSSRRARDAEVARLVAEARPLLEKDTWRGLQQASERCERAIAADGGAADARACAAWTAAVRFADHGEDAQREVARRHLAALGSDAPARGAAAAAVLRVAEGDPRGAAEALRGRAAKDGTPTLRSALGEALLAAGDLDGARDALLQAQRAAPGDVRVVRLLAEQFRRRGTPDALAQAEVLYEIALGKLSADDAGALLGRARLLLDRKATAEALALAGRVAASDAASPRQHAVAEAVRARALAASGKPEQAAAAQRAAQRLDPTGREVRELLLQAPLARGS